MSIDRAQMGKSSRRRGGDFERWVVRQAKAAGLDADTGGWKQRRKGDVDQCADCTIGGQRIECKYLRNIPNWPELVAALVQQRPAAVGDTLRAYMKGHDALVLKNHGWGTLILVVLTDRRVITLDEYFRLIARADAP